MNDSAITILASMTASSALTTVIVWLTKTWVSERLKNAIKHEYDQRLESYKATIQAEHNAALEHLKADLRIVAFERETRFAELHAHRAKIIAEFHAHLQDFTITVTRFLKPDDNSVSFEQLRKEHGKCFEYFRQNKIYLPEKTEKQIDEFDDHLLSFLEDDSLDVKTKYTQFVHKTRELFKNLKSEFRKLLGDKH